MSENNTENTVDTETSVDSGIPEVHFALEVAETVQTPVDDTLSISGMAADAKAVGDAITDATTDMQNALDDLEESVGTQIGEIETAVAAVYGLLFPVGSIYVSTSSTAPTFGTGWNWQEIKIPATWGDLEDGFRSYDSVESGDETGTMHFWLRLPDEEG